LDHVARILAVGKAFAFLVNSPGATINPEMPFPVYVNRACSRCGKLCASLERENGSYFQEWLTKLKGQERSIPLLDVPGWYPKEFSKGLFDNDVH
jgi:hypothetical protein